MRVLLVAPQPFYRDRGTPIAVRQVVVALGELGHQIDLLTFPTGEDVVAPGLEIHRIGNPGAGRDVPIGFSPRKAWLDLRLVAATRRLLHERKYDVVHAVEEAAFFGVALAHRRGLPLVYDMQSSLPEQLESHPLLGSSLIQPGLERAESWLIRHSDAIGCSCGLADHVRSIDPDAEVHEWWFVPDRVETDPEVVTGLRRELGIDAASRIVLYTGNFSGYQGVPLLLQAVSRVQREVPEALFVLVGGRHEDLPGPPEAVAELERSGALRLVDRQPRSRMAAYVAAADVLVSPRNHGGNLPLKIFDYLSAGKPIVATDTPTHRTVLDDDRALLVPMSARDLAASITMILRDPERADSLARSARGWAEVQLGPDSFRERVSTLYDAAVAAFDEGKPDERSTP